MITSDSVSKNHLADEKSPYLLQHATNPVDWYPWGKAALTKAAGENKPIFVSIGYSTCHWCHVMAHESFEDPRVAERLNRSFVSIKVDREERPDIDAAYMQACQMINRHGGWPLNLFLTPDGKPFYALTYAPKESRDGQPGFTAIIDKIAELWRQQADALIRSGDELANAIQQMEDSRQTAEDLDEGILAAAANSFAAGFDDRHGGFGSAPKFPQPHNASLLFRLARRYADPKLEELALKTLDRIRRGGITDQLGGGLHRYSVDERWLVPHFEKMLYDQALISEAYLDAWQATRDERYSKAAEHVLDYVLAELQDPQGGFYCGEDADSEGSEGTFYLWTLDQVREALGEREAELICNVYNITARGHFEGRSIPHRTEPLEVLARANNMTEQELAQQLARSGRKLMQVRKDRPRPHLDDKILTGWNGLMIAALARAGALLNRPDYLKAARRALAFIREKLVVDNALRRRYRDGETAVAAFHEDYAYLTHGLIELFMAEHDPEVLRFALELTDKSIALFADDRGGFFDSAQAFVAGLGRGRGKQDGAIPAAASVAAHNLIRLGRLTGNDELELRSREILTLHLPQADQYPTAFAYLLMALDLTLSERFSLVIASESRQLPRPWRDLVSRFRPALPVIIVADDNDLTDLLPATAGKTGQSGTTTAWFCTGSGCLPPVRQPDQLDRLLEDHIPLKTFNR